MASVNTIIDKYTERAPVNIEGIIQDLKINLEKITRCSKESPGALLRNPNGSFKIMINANDSYYRQRFTMAQLLSHYLMHLHKIGPGFKASYDFLFKDTEFWENREKENGITADLVNQANNCAVNLLTPEHLVITLNSEFNGDVYKLAQRFYISEKSMQNRLNMIKTTSYQYAA